MQLQMPNIRQAFVQPVQPLLQNAQTLPGLPPLPQNKTQLGVLPYAQESRVPTQVQIQHPQLTQNQVIQPYPLLAQPGVSAHPSIQTSSSFNQQMLQPLSQNATPVTPINSGHIDRRMSQHVSVHPSNLVHPQYSVAGLQVPISLI